MSVYNSLLKTIREKGAAYLILVDPDKNDDKKLAAFIRYCETNGVDGFLIGGTLLLNKNFSNSVKIIKQNTSLPVIIFPGNIYQVNESADAILFLSVISGRNSEDLIGKHVIAAPLIRNSGLEVIPTGYMLIESGRITSAQYMSGSMPMPADKPEIAAATALAGEYLGMKLIYLEAGSGAEYSVPAEIVKAVSQYCSIPVITGGGIRTPVAAREKVENGASVVVTGNFFEDENNWSLIKEFARAVHTRRPVEV